MPVTDRRDEEVVAEAAVASEPTTDVQRTNGEPEPEPEAVSQDLTEPVAEVGLAGTGRGRRAGFAIGRAVVILVAAAVVYELVIPYTHIDRTRLAQLVPTTSGLATFAKTTPQAEEQNDGQSALAAVAGAAKTSPSRTGIYSIVWSASQTSLAGIIAFLLPDVATAQAASSQIRSQQMGVTTYATDSLDRKSTGSVAGVPGSYTATYEPSAQAPKGTPSLEVTEFLYGRIDSLTEAVGTASSVSGDAASLTAGEYALLERQGGQVGLTVKEYPVGLTAGWAAGAVVLAAAFALSPVLRRRRAEKRRLAFEAAMANRVIVKGQIITKRRQ
jgi:hypothetical protein